MRLDDQAKGRFYTVSSPFESPPFLDWLAKAALRPDERVLDLKQENSNPLPDRAKLAFAKTMWNSLAMKSANT